MHACIPTLQKAAEAEAEAAEAEAGVMAPPGKYKYIVMAQLGDGSTGGWLNWRLHQVNINI
jgi:hypothetical protein